MCEQQNNRNFKSLQAKTSKHQYPPELHKWLTVEFFLLQSLYCLQITVKKAAVTVVNMYNRKHQNEK